MAFFPSLCNTTHSWYEWTRSKTTTGGILMNASNDNTAAKGLRGWWASPLAIRNAPPDPPMGVSPPPLLWGHAYCRWQCRGRRGHRVPLVRRLRMGSLLPGSWGAESRGWLLVPHYRSLRICPNLSLVRRPPGRRCRTRGSSGRWSPGTCRATGGFHLVPVVAEQACG